MSKYNSSDFTLDMYDRAYGDYWYKVSGETAEILKREYPADGMKKVTGVVYITNDNNIGICRQYDRDHDTMIVEDNEELKEVIKNLSKKGDL